MKVKRYIVNELPEAVQQIRAELGSDAVILNTKEIRVGGFLGMFRKKRMEVIAAIDEAAKKQPSRASLPVRPAETRPSPSLEEEPLLAKPLMTSGAVRNRYTQAPFSDSGRVPSGGISPSPAPTPAKEIEPAERTVPSYSAQAAAADRESRAMPEQAAADDRFSRASEARSVLKDEADSERDRLDRFRTSLAERLVKPRRPPNPPPSRRRRRRQRRRPKTSLPPCFGSFAP